jgi:SAM-dependent methyltransferase
MKLLLGCGKTKMPNAIGVDSVLISEYVDVVHDLNIVPYPIPDQACDEVHMYHVLEHLDNPIEKLEEIHRVLKKGGMLYLRVPHFSSCGAFSDITHKRPYGYTSFDCFTEDNYHGYYTNIKYKIIKKKIKYFGMYPNKGDYEKYIHKNSCPFLIRPIVVIINKLIECSPSFFERIWCYYVGGACELELEMEAI